MYLRIAASNNPIPQLSKKPIPIFISRKMPYNKLLHFFNSLYASTVLLGQLCIPLTQTPSPTAIIAYPTS
jgi:hypothetical protein